MFASSLPPVVCEMDHVLFTLFVFVCVKWCPTNILCPMLVVSLDCRFFCIAPSVFFTVYIEYMQVIVRHLALISVSSCYDLYNTGYNLHAPY